MCGIVGFLAKQESLRSRLGEFVTPMFACMAARGPDSGGLAVFGEPSGETMRHYSLFVRDRGYDWARLEAAFSDTRSPGNGSSVSLLSRQNHAILVAAGGPAEVEQWLGDYDASIHVLSVGKSIDVFKDEGDPVEIAARFGFAELTGTHAVGHTRMATESAVTPQHSHPFTAGEDFCLVHNGSLSNPYMLQRKLRREGLEFESDNDTEAACRYLEWRLRQGETLEAALETGFAELDGFYTLLIGTADRITLVRDAFACKPAVVAEHDDYVAIGSEFRALAHLPDVSNAHLYEPKPEVIYSWKV